MAQDNAKALVEANLLKQEDVDKLDAETLERLNEITGGRVAQDLQEARRSAESSGEGGEGAGSPSLFF